MFDLVLQCHILLSEDLRPISEQQDESLFVATNRSLC